MKANGRHRTGLHKEHRLQDLEDKVKELEDEKSIAHYKNEF